MTLPVNILSVADPDNGHNLRRVVDLVEDAIPARANPPSLFVALQLLAAGRSRNFSQGQHFSLDHLKHGGGNCFKFFLCPIRDDYAVVHFRLRRISARACSSGIGTSPAAFACSYSRTACKSSRSSNSSRSRSYSSMLITTAIFSPFSLVRNCVGAFMVSPLAKSNAAEHERQQSTAEDALGLGCMTGNQIILRQRRKL